MVLTDVNIEIPSAKLTMVIGRVASGKSTLLKGILKETKITKGVHSPSRSVAFCDQTAFLTNRSIRDNIVGYDVVDEMWFGHVIDATDIRQDILTFPQHENTLIGSNGINLSGGQRQRIALARALYARPKLAILDDVLSGLDRETEQRVFQNVLGPGGLFSRIGTTTILATQSVRYLSAADHVVLLEGGTVARSGSFDDIKTHASYSHLQSWKPTDEAAAQASAVDKTPVSSRDPNAALEDSSRHHSSMSTYRYYLASIGTPFLVIFVISGLIFAFLYNFGTVWLEFWSSAIDNGEPRDSFYFGIYNLIQVSCLACMAIYVSFAGIWMS